MKLSSAQHLEPNPQKSSFYLTPNYLALQEKEGSLLLDKSKSIKSVLESLTRTQITVNLVCHETLICNISRDNTGCQPYQIRNWAKQVSETTKEYIMFCWVIDKLARNAFSGGRHEASFKLNKKVSD